MKNYQRTVLTFAAAALLAGRGLIYAQGPDHGFGPPHHPDLTEMLSHRLQLTDEQKTKVQAEVQKVQPQLDAIHKQAHDQADAIITQLHAQIRPMLNADQQKKLDAIDTLRQSDSKPE